MIRILKQFRKSTNDNGFSLLELAIGIGIVLVLTAGGLLIYSETNKNAKMSSYRVLTNEIYTIAVNARSTGSPNDIFDSVIEWGEEKGMVLYFNQIRPEKTCPDQVALLDIDWDKAVNGEDVDYVRYMVAIDKKSSTPSILVQVYDSTIVDDSGTPVPITIAESSFDNDFYCELGTV